MLNKAGESASPSRRSLRLVNTPTPERDDHALSNNASLRSSPGPFSFHPEASQYLIIRSVGAPGSMERAGSYQTLVMKTEGSGSTVGSHQVFSQGQLPSALDLPEADIEAVMTLLKNRMNTSDSGIGAGSLGLTMTDGERYHVWAYQQRGTTPASDHVDSF